MRISYPQEVHPHEKKQSEEAQQKAAVRAHQSQAPHEPGTSGVLTA
jgi:hypothetical protein